MTRCVLHGRGWRPGSPDCSFTSPNNYSRGYVTVTPDYKFRVSRRLENDWKHGKICYAL